MRLKASKKRKDIAEGVNELCLPCVIRKEIHSLTCKLAPNAFPKDAQTWPFLYRNEESRAEQERKMKTDVKSLDVIKLPAIGDAVSNGWRLERDLCLPRAASAYRRWMRMRR